MSDKDECACCSRPWNLENQLSDAAVQLSTAQAQIAELREALEKYGDHSTFCDNRKPWKIATCTCGLDKALATKEHPK